MRMTLAVMLLCTFAPINDLNADDWPQYLGLRQEGVCREAGIVDRIPPGGVQVKWRVPVGWGYSGPSIADGKVYVLDYACTQGKSTNNPGGRDRLLGKEGVKCFDARDGALIWQHAYNRPYSLSFAKGPRCTPTVDGPRVYALGAEGNLSCLDTATGKVLWNKDFVEEYGAKTAIWGVAAHPLVDGNRLYCVVGGEGSVAVAFDKRTGKEIWRALSASQPGYCPPTLIEQGGRTELLIWHGDSINALEPATGNLIWTVPVKPNHGMAIAPPRKLGSRLLVSGYGAAVLLQLSDDGSKAEVIWKASPKMAMFCGNSAPQLEGGIAYGCDINTGALMGVRLSDGKRLWQTFEPTFGGNRPNRYGTAFLVKHGSRFFLWSEAGDLILARLSPAGYEEMGRAHVLEPTNQAFGRPVVWSPPAFADRCLFVRNDEELVCVDLAAVAGSNY